MYVVIFGNRSCPYCILAKEFAKKIKDNCNDFDYRYVDIYSENITKEDLSKIAGKHIETVPQIFIDKKHIGGYIDFKSYIEMLNK
ncbi:Glutaredoxin-1 [Candidatus Providencia siddallii]|uniref:Glutaredoxin-1 n=1 Tax=Candidatus Providencia siddallii TaxID=1715285 RepID=A0A0M6W6S2_9GAMM|nr:Glutaredoxin-1 [Candidatus Providencia siddallii]